MMFNNQTDYDFFLGWNSTGMLLRVYRIYPEQEGAYYCLCRLQPCRFLSTRLRNSALPVQVSHHPGWIDKGNKASIPSSIGPLPRFCFPPPSKVPSLFDNVRRVFLRYSHKPSFVP